MQAACWRDTMWQQAMRLLPPEPVAPYPLPATRPDFGLDALDFVELLLEVEQHFGFRFSATQLEDLRTAQLVLDSAEQPRRRHLYAQFFAQLMHTKECA